MQHNQNQQKWSWGISGMSKLPASVAKYQNEVSLLSEKKPLSPCVPSQGIKSLKTKGIY